MRRVFETYDLPFGGMLKGDALQFELGIISNSDPIHRTIDVVWTNREGGRINIPLLRSAADWSMPYQGDVAVVIFNRVEQAICIGYLDPNYGFQLEYDEAEKIEAGEVAILGRILSPDQNFDASRLRFTKNGDVFLETTVGDGILIRNKDKTIVLRSQSVREETMAGEMVNGRVVRKIEIAGVPLPGVDAVPSLDDIAAEQGFVAEDPLTGLKRARMILGDITDDLGILEFSPLTATPLLIVLQALADKIPLAGVSIDKLGNVIIQTLAPTGQIIIIGHVVSLTAALQLNIKAPTVQVEATNVQVNAASIALGGPTGLALVQETVLSLLANHTHPVTVDPGSHTGNTLPSGQIIGITTMKTEITKAL